MTALVQIRSRFRQAIAPILGSILVVYFSYHMVQGDHGLIAYMSLQAKVAQAESRYAQVHAERADLERSVALMRPDNLDPDMLEERARTVLDFVHPDDVVILLPQRK